MDSIEIYAGSDLGIGARCVERELPPHAETNRPDGGSGHGVVRQEILDRTI